MTARFTTPSASLSAKYLWALSTEGRTALSDLIEAGLDPDLAFSVLEALVPETTLYTTFEDDDGHAGQAR